MEKEDNSSRLHENLINFERSILSSIIFEPENLIDISDRLKPHQLYYVAHKTIYEAILKIYRSDRPIDESFIDQELKGNYRKELADIMIANPVSNYFPYVSEVVEQYRRREMRKLAMEIMKANEAEKSSDAIIGEIEGFIANIDEGDEDMGVSFTQLKDDYNRNPASPVYATGVSFIDESLNGGFEMGQFVLMSGDPEAGKTVLTLQILKNVSEYAPAIMFAFEFTTRSLVKMQLKTEGDKYVNDNLILIDKGYDISDIERKIKKWTRKGAKFFVIDSQMRIENANNTKGTMEERESEKFSRLAKLAHSQDILIILIIQNSKADTSASVISPMGSKKGAHEASIIMHLKRLKDDEKEGGEKEMRELIMSKNKQTGQHYKGKINFNPYALKFTRPYGHSGSVEYEGHKKKGTVHVEHEDKHGKKTGSSSITLGIGLMLDEDNDEKINMAVL
jgi:DNA repair protein RadA/Sms